MKYLINEIEVELEEFNRHLSYDIALTGSDGINPLLEKHFEVNGNLYSVITDNDNVNKWIPTEEEYNLIWGLESSLIFVNDAAIYRKNHLLFLTYDADDTVVRIPIKPHLFPIVEDDEIMAISYLKLKMEEYNL